MSTPPRAGRPGRVEIAVVAVIVGAAALLRFGDLGLMELKGDEAVALELALPMLEGRELPKVGLVSSVGVHNPPLFVHLVALPAWLSVDPLFVTGALVGLLGVLAVALTWLVLRRRFGPFSAATAAALLACSTWPVLYGRKLWAQDVLPLFCVLLLHVLLLVHERPRTRWAAALPVLLCALWQLHFSAFAFVIISAVLLLRVIRRVNLPALCAGIVAALLMLGPYLHYQAKNDYQDIRGLARIAAGKRADGTEREAPKEWSLEPVRWTGYVSSGTRLDYALGPSAAEEYAGWQRRPGLELRRFAEVFGGAMLGLGLLLLLAPVGRRLLVRLRSRAPLPADVEHERRIVLLAWFVGFLAIFVLVRLERVFPHYFIILYPVPFVLVALPLGALSRRFGKAGMASAVGVVVLLLAAHLSGLFSFRGYLLEKGGTSGDYGIAYRHKAALTGWVVANGLSYRAAPGFEYGFLAELARKYGDMEEMTLAAERRPAPPAGRRGLRVYDSLRFPRAVTMRCEGRQDFGPLVACPER